MSVVAASRPYVKPSSRKRARHALPPLAESWPHLMVAALCLAAFGPYVAGPVRTEQLAVYAMAPLVLFTFTRLRTWSFGLLGAWMFFILATTLGLLLPYRGMPLWPPGSALAGFDNLLLPLMIMLGIWSLIPAAAALPVLRTAARTVGIAAAANGLIAAVSTTVPLSDYLRPFWGNEAISSTVAERAMTNGRFAGVFGQPAEAGLMYSVAAVLVVWGFSNQRTFMYSLLVFITVGGMLSVSKVFLLIGLPVALVFLWVTQRGAARIWMVICAVLFLVFLSTASFFREWAGLDYLLRLLDVPYGTSAIEHYTAGRWNEDAPMLQVIGFVLSASPVVGMGVVGMEVAYDSQWTETIVLGGLIGTACVIAVFYLLLAGFRRVEDKGARLMGYAFWIVLVGGSFGIMSLTVNRAATVVWVVAALLLLAHSPRPAESSTARRRKRAERVGPAYKVDPTTGRVMKTRPSSIRP